MESTFVDVIYGGIFYSSTFLEKPRICWRDSDKMKTNKDMQIDLFFSSPIAIFKNENFDLTEHCLEIKDKYPITGNRGNCWYNYNDWVHNPYNSLHIIKQYSTLNAPKFLELNRWVQECVDEFSQECGYHKMRPQDLWFNVYERGDSQEFHNHCQSHLSCVYFAEVKDDDAKIIFNRTPWVMFPIPVTEPNPYNYDQVWFQPTKGMLLIFKSDTMHMVERKVTDDIRISFSYNFISTSFDQVQPT